MKKAIKKIRKTRKRKVKPKRKIRRKFKFGESAPVIKSSTYGYNDTETRKQGILDQSSMIVTDKSRAYRPGDFQVSEDSGSIYGVYTPFFGEHVPKVVPPSWSCMGQADGSCYPLGGDVSAFRTPAFGKKKYRKFK